MVVVLQVFRLNEPILSVLPIYFHGLSIWFQLPCKGVDGPIGVELLVQETKRLALSQKCDIIRVETGFFKNLPLGCFLGILICGIDGSRADCPFSSVLWSAPANRLKAEVYVYCT
jgi:hypothetical protein